MNHSKTNNAYNLNKFKEIKGKHKFFEEKYLNLFKDSPFAMLFSDNQGNVIECNSKAISLFGYEKYEIIGKNFQEFPILSAENIKFTLNDFETLLNGYQPQPREFNIYKKDRSRIWVKFYISLVTCNDETIYQIIIQDISGRKTAEQKLKDSEEIFRKVSEKANYGIILTESDGTIYYWNKAAENLYGYSYKETEGKNIYDLIISEDFKVQFKKGIDRFKKTGELSLDGRVIDYPGKKKDGTLIPLEISFSRVRINNQWHALAIVKDISERKELKQEISETETKFRLLTDQNLMGIGIYQYDLFVYVNQAYADIIEYSIPEILSWDLEEIKKTIHPDDIDLVMGQSKKKQSGVINGILTHYTFRKITKSHKIKWVDHYSKQILWNGETAVLLAQIDITELVDTEKRLIESEEKFRNIVESVPLGLHMYEIDSAGNLIFTGSNSTADKILRLNNEQFIGKTIEEAFPHLKETDIPDRCRIAALKGEPSKWEQVTYEDEKIKGAFEVHAFQTSPGKIVASFTDITERLVAEKKIKESEEKYRSLFENMTVGFAYHKIIVDENKKPIDYEFLEANPAFEKLTGLNAKEIIGKTVTEVLPGIENDSTDWIGKYGEVALTGIPTTFESYAEPLDQWYSVLSYSPKKGYFAVTFTNITDRKKSEQKLKESEEKFRTITEQSFMGIEILHEGKVVYANEAAAKILDYPLEEIMMWSKSSEIIQCIHPEDLQRLREQRRRRQRGDSNLKPNISYRIITKSGKIKWIDQHSKVIIYHGKEAELISIIDITEKKHAEEIILQENLKLMELNKMREDLITRVSHELKTPLTSIYGASQVLLNRFKGELNEKVLNFVEISHRGGIRLKKLIENLIDTSKLKSGKLILNRTYEDVVAVVNECVKEMMFLAQNRNIVINIDLNNKISLKVDKLRLEQVITNILSNAIKNTPSLGRIYVSIIETKNNVDIIIKDTGIGITLEEKKLLFEKFGKIERYGMDLGVDIEGAGLGLFISKEIVELHGGQIIVESEGRNKGTEVTIKLLK